MFIKYIMQLSSTILKNEYDLVPVWIAQMVPIRTPQYIPKHFSTPPPPKKKKKKKTPYFVIMYLFYQMFDD